MSKDAPSPEIFNLMLNTDGDCLFTIANQEKFVQLEQIRQVFDMVGPDSSISLMPPVVRSFSTDMTQFLIERIPFRTTVHYYSPKGSLTSTDFTIWLPWTYYYITLSGPPHWTVSSCAVYCRNSQLSSEIDLLYRFCFPNVDYYTDLICFGHASDYTKANQPGDLYSTISSTINDFWSTSFNNDMGETVYRGNKTLSELAETIPINDELEKFLLAVFDTTELNESQQPFARRSDAHLLGIWEKLDLEDVLKFEYKREIEVGTILSKMQSTQENLPTTASNFANWIHRSIGVS